MKIILDIPDETACGYFVFTEYTDNGALMRCIPISKENLGDGVEIEISPHKEQDDKL